jgi:restriction endonuclease Mrr
MTDKVQEVKKASAWTEQEEAAIAANMEKLGMTRSHAVRKMRADAARAAKPVAAKEVNTLAVKMAKQAVKAVARAKKAVAKEDRAEAKHLSPAKLEEITVAVRKLIGKGRVIEKKLKSSLNPKYSRYVWLAVDNGQVVHVNIDSMTTCYLAETSSTVKAWRRRVAAAKKA